MRRTAPLVIALVVALMVAATAAAVAPTLTVSAQDRRPQATFSAPFASSVTIYFASKPARATDGQFFSENIETLDSLNDDEIAAGRWLSEARLDPGTYYVMLNASPDFNRCFVLGSGGQYDPQCADGYSTVSTLTVPEPETRYSVSTEVLRYLGVVKATLRATQLGEKRAYRVCYATAARKQRCTTGTLSGYSWDSAASHTLRLSPRFMPKTTTLTWWVGTRKVASKLVRVR